MSDDNVTLTPTFIIYINGTRFGVEHEASVRQILVNDQFNRPSTCRIILSDIQRQWVDSAILNWPNPFRFFWDSRMRWKRFSTAKS